MTLEEYKQSIIEYMDFGIKHTDLEDAYFIGFRNGIRWCKSLVDGVEPIYESVADTPQTDMDEDIVRSYGFKVESYRQAKAKDEPQTDCGWK